MPQRDRSHALCGHPVVDCVFVCSARPAEPPSTPAGWLAALGGRQGVPRVQHHRHSASCIHSALDPVDQFDSCLPALCVSAQAQTFLFAVHDLCLGTALFTPIKVR